jgi:hypothetical protein
MNIIDDITTNDFLGLLYKAVPYGWLELTLIKPESYPKVYWMALPNQMSDAQLAFLHEQNEYGYNVYYGVTVRSERKDKGRAHVKDAMFTRVLWVDMDDKSQEAYQRLHDAKASLIIDSGGGYHGYWLLNQSLVMNGFDVPENVNGVFQAADDALLKRTLKGMAIALQGDVKVAEFARIMRLPGFRNMKEGRDKALCGVVQDRLFTYDFGTLANQYAYLVKENLRVERSLPVSVSGDLPPYIRQYMESGAPVGERNSTFNNMCWEYNRLGKIRMDAERDLAPRARADGLEEHEIQATLDSAFRVAAPPRDSRIAARDRGMVTE